MKEKIVVTYLTDSKPIAAALLSLNQTDVVTSIISRPLSEMATETVVTVKAEGAAFVRQFLTAFVDNPIMGKVGYLDENNNG